MEGIIGLLAAMAIIVLPVILKAVMKAIFGAQPSHPSRPVPSGHPQGPLFSDAENEVAVADSEMRKKKAKFPKEQEYFTYETLDNDSPQIRDMEKKETNENMQSVDNKVEVTLSDEEIYKGFIYSEILNRKYK